MLRVQQPQRLPLRQQAAAGRAEEGLLLAGQGHGIHHVQEDHAGHRVRSQRNAARQPSHQGLRMGRVQLQGTPILLTTPCPK